MHIIALPPQQVNLVTPEHSGVGLVTIKQKHHPELDSGPQQIPVQLVARETCNPPSLHHNADLLQEHPLSCEQRLCLNAISCASPNWAEWLILVIETSYWISEHKINDTSNIRWYLVTMGLAWYWRKCLNLQCSKALQINAHSHHDRNRLRQKLSAQKAELQLSNSTTLG